MADRYFSEQPITADRATLDGSEAHHLIHVLRAKPGGRVTLFDGSGAEFVAEIAKTLRSSVELDILERNEIDRELPFELTIGVALPKGDRQRWLVEKAVELGVSRIVPLRTARSVAQPVDKALSRLRRSVIEASKQCGRNRLMAIEPAQDWSAFVTAEAGAAVRLLAHPGHDEKLPLRQMFGGAMLAVGPEGGFIDDEVQLAIEAGWRTVSLGPRILRIETAAIILAAIVSRQV